jgi:hypothetical protein
VGKRTYDHVFLVAPLDVEYSGILRVDALRHMEARVDLRISTLVLGRTSFQLSGQEVERCALIRRQPQIASEVSRTGLTTPETIGSYASAGTSIPGLSSGGTDIGSWEVVAHGSVILPPLCEGLVIGKVVIKRN